MIAPSITSTRIFAFPFFLISFVVSFFLPQLYKDIVFIQFMLLGPLVILFSYKFRSLTQTAQLLFLVYTGCTIAFGVPGSALGYAISASIGLFVSQIFIPEDDRFKQFEFRMYVLSGVIFVIACLNLLYSNFRITFTIEQIADYFGQASINYASLTVASFCSIFATWCSVKQFGSSFLSKKQIIALRVVSGILAFCILGMSIIFSTRSAILGFLPPFLFAFQPKRPYLYISGIIIIGVLVYFIFPVFSELVLLFVVPGRDNLGDLYSSELYGQERSESALLIFKKAIPKFTLCIGCSDYLSFSGISNLLALSFPFSIFYFYQIVKFLIKYIKAFFISYGIHKLLLFIVIMSFFNSFLLAVFQADFLSTVSLFYVIGCGLSLFKEKILVFVKPADIIQKPRVQNKVNKFYYPFT
jgi:hypothetical protein